MKQIVSPVHFIQATRDAGYRGLATALAELIDNSLDAGASEVDIQISETRTSQRREITISVLDNGSGMDKATLWRSLRFGGSERFNGRNSLGRYGMGLPNSSVSQAPRVDVYTWRAGATPLRAHLDVDDITARRSRGVGEPVACAPPQWAGHRHSSGTLVEWSRCDRLRFKKASTLASKLHHALGRMYRLPLSDTLKLRINDMLVEARDPLFRSSINGLQGTCEPYGEPIRYRLKSPEHGDAVVEVQFVELPITQWHDLPVKTKRDVGIVGGAGLSVIRGSREIDYGWHLFGGKRRENYDDWWRAELRFPPTLDELFGITHSKQGVHPAPQLRAILEPDLEKIARDLNRRARTTFQRLRGGEDHRTVRRASSRDRLLPAVKTTRAGTRRPTGGGFRFRIGFHDKACPEFFETEVENTFIQIRINQNHPFYKKLYASPSHDNSDLDMLLLSAARALFDLSDDARQTLMRSWSDNLLAYLAN